MVSAQMKALRQPGFSFGRSLPFKGEVMALFDAAVIGPVRDVKTEDLKAGVNKRMMQLFELCLQNDVFYRASRGSDVFWDLVNEQWEIIEYTDGKSAAAFADGYRAAREKSDSGVPIGELSDLVDKFIDMRQETMALAPAEKFEINIPRPAMTILTHALARMGVNTPAVNPKTEVGQWPPAHFNEQEVAWLCSEHLLSQLYGLTTAKQVKQASDFPKIPGCYTHPLDVRLFLAFTALTNLGPDRKMSLCMAPISFWDDDERKDWHKASGGASKLSWTTWEFCQWAQKEFKNGREAVAGFCYFHIMGKSAEPWKHYEDSAGVLLRKLKENSYELVFEDGYYTLITNFKDKYEKDGHTADNGMDFKSAMVEDIQRHFRLTSVWYGGYPPNTFTKYGIEVASLNETVCRSCSFVYMAARNEVPELYLSRPGWDFSTDVPEYIAYEEEEKSVVVFENDGIDSDAPVEKDDRVPLSDSDEEEYVQKDDENDSDYVP
ncbi:hypothetical protein F5Y17DRAFT_463292 [Xylariaceae sp. FL0594]|nr:hypothetical protein F5Y17DRAFT_463292 [Xylariaceae sp. FL0594]